MTSGISDTRSVKNCIGNRLKQARKRKKLSQTQLCDMLSAHELAPIIHDERASLQPGTYKKWEDGTNDFSFEWLPAIFSVLECDAGYLFGDYPEQKREASDMVQFTGLSEDAIWAMQKLMTKYMNYPLFFHWINRFIAEEKLILIFDRLYNHFHHAFMVEKEKWYAQYSTSPEYSASIVKSEEDFSDAEMFRLSKMLYGFAEELRTIAQEDWNSQVDDI